MRGNRLRTKVLIVEDERHIAKFLKFVLRKADYEVATAYTGEQALASIDPLAPDVVLLALVLPGISGLEVLKCLHTDASHADLVVIALSGRSFHSPVPFPCPAIDALPTRQQTCLDVYFEGHLTGKMVLCGVRHRAMLRTNRIFAIFPMKAGAVSALQDVEGSDSGSIL
jgi:CheY-like chemotaxis protein